MKILLCYSKFHFNPEISDDKNQYSESSAAINAKTLYNVVQNFGEVDYIDFTEWERVIGNEYDLFIGINHNFDNIIKNIKAKIIIYYAVNQHPISRNKIIRNFKFSNKITDIIPKFLRKTCLRKIFNMDYREEYAPIVNGINKADYILCLGNDIVKQSYIRQGCDPKRIILINYEIMKGNAQPKKSFSPIPTILYVCTNLCQRKGFDIVYELVSKLQAKDYNFKFTIIGDSTNYYYKNRRKKLKRILKNKMNVYECIYKDEYHKKIQEHDFLLFPSIEEGQAGTVLDALHNGLIPIITQESGVNYSPLGYLEPKLHSSKNFAIIKKIFSLEGEDVIRLSQEAANYYDKNHLNFEKRLYDILNEIVNKTL